jgi:HemY protein
MMKWLFTLLLVLVLTVSGVLLVMKDPGYALFSIGDYTIETTLSLLVVVLIIGYVLLGLLIRIVAGIWELPERMHNWSQHRRRKRARWELYQGLVELDQGHWKSAEKRLQRHAAESEVPLLNYLGAARAAQQMGDQEKRDQYLQRAYEHSPGSDLALGLTRAELQITQGQFEQALAGLNNLREREPGNVLIQRLLLQLYPQLGEWRKLRDLLPALRKEKLVTEQQLQELEYQCASHLMKEAARSGSAQSLREEWNAMSRKLRDQDRLILEYAHHLQSLNEGHEAEGLLRNALKYRWNTAMVYLYGKVSGADNAQQIRVAEKWLKENGRDAVLHLTLGRLCLRERLWGKARIYLETSLELEPRSETYKELGALLEHLGDTEAATDCYRSGLGLAVEATVDDMPEFSIPQKEADEATDQQEEAVQQGKTGETVPGKDEEIESLGEDAEVTTLKKDEPEKAS